MKKTLNTYKAITLSIASLLVVVIGVIFFKFQIISEDFNAFTGIKSGISLLMGNEFVEIKNNNNEEFLMVKRSIRTQTYLDNLNSAGYVCDRVIDADDYTCKKNGEALFLPSESYTKYFTIFKIENIDNPL